MTNKYLEKIAADYKADAKKHYWEGAGRMEQGIASQYGKTVSDKGWWGNMKHQSALGSEQGKGTAIKSIGGNIVGGAAGFGVGSAIGHGLSKIPKFAKNPYLQGGSAMLGGFLGSTAGGLMAVKGRQTRNLEGMSERMHDQYSKD
jgi:hypothetical protein